MIQNIITYPSPPSVEYSTDVRTVSDEIIGIIEDLKDTIEANSLEALTAFQIGSMYNIVILKQDDGSFLELLNPRVLNPQGSVTTTETTAYFPNLSAQVTRHETISVVYEDRNLQQHSLRAQGDLSILLQRKIDYTFGSSFINKLSIEEKAIFEKKLEFGRDVAISEVCPTTFKRDHILKAINILMIGMVLLLVSSFFMDFEDTSLSLWDYQSYAAYTTLGLGVVYFFYAQYEGKKFISCDSCQIGNILGTLVIIFVKLTIIMLLSFFTIY